MGTLVLHHSINFHSLSVYLLCVTQMWQMWRYTHTALQRATTSTTRNREKNERKPLIQHTPKAELTVGGTHKAANYFQVFRSRWAKEAETLTPWSDAKQGEQQQQLSFCLFGFNQHSAQMCTNKHQNQSESTWISYPSPQKTAIKHNFLLTDPHLS